MRYGSELVITGTSSADTIDVSQSGSLMSISVNGLVYTQTVPSAGLFVYSRGGSDSIVIESSVSIRTTVDAIDGSSTTISISGSNVSVWMDSTDAETGTTTGLHKVASFAGGVSKNIGAALPNPKDSKRAVAVTNLSLFGTGPVADDVNQGSTGDCWFLASLAAFAGQKPGLIQESAVDMGDGTYVVQYYRNGTATYLRVSNQFSTGNFNGFYYAQPGANNTLWAVVMEKALCYFRSGKNTYRSISGGFASEAYADLNAKSTTTSPGSYTESSLYTAISKDLSGGLPVVFGTRTNAPNLVGNHEYTIISCSIDADGVTHYVVRNPWGVSGDSLEDNFGYATITFAQLVANASDITQAV